MHRIHLSAALIALGLTLPGQTSAAPRPRRQAPPMNATQRHAADEYIAETLLSIGRQAYAKRKYSLAWEVFEEVRGFSQARELAPRFETVALAWLALEAAKRGDYSKTWKVAMKARTQAIRSGGRGAGELVTIDAVLEVVKLARKLSNGPEKPLGLYTLWVETDGARAKVRFKDGRVIGFWPYAKKMGWKPGVNPPRGSGSGGEELSAKTHLPGRASVSFTAKLTGMKRGERVRRIQVVHPRPSGALTIPGRRLEGAAPGTYRMVVPTDAGLEGLLLEVMLTQRRRRRRLRWVFTCEELRNRAEVEFLLPGAGPGKRTAKDGCWKALGE